MEFVADGMDSLELGVCDLDAFLIEPRIHVAFDFQAGVGCRRGDQFDHRRRSVKGRPRQFCVMWQNIRCSILFHLDVPGG